MKKSLKIIRVITVAPIMAFLLFTILYIFRNQFFDSWWQYAYSVFCLTVLPLLAYPLQRFIPGFKDRGREGQRSLAIVFSVVGYILCCIFGLIFTQSNELWIITLTYLCSGIGIFLSGKVFKFKSSGHACGIIGPVSVLILFGLYIPAIVGIALAALTFYASVASKRHTATEFVGGGVMPVAISLAFFCIL